MMKTTSIIRLAFKNLYNNFSRSILTLISITLLSIVIMTMCNLCYYFKVNSYADVISYNKMNGIDVDFSVGLDDNGNKLIEKLDNQDIADFIERTKALNILQEYEFEYGNIVCPISIEPYLGGETKLTGNPLLVSGEFWNATDNGKNFILLSKDISQSQNINISDKMMITINGSNNEFTVKGIVDSSDSFVDYSYFDITKVIVYDKVNEYKDLSIPKKLLILKKTEPINTTIFGSTIDHYKYFKLSNLFVFGICSFLTLLCILLSMGCVLNTLKISIEENSYSIGIMKALGMRKNKITLYILNQVFILILLGTIISTVISWLIAIFTLDPQLKIVLDMFSMDSDLNTLTGFNFLLPLLNAIILTMSLLLGSLKMLKKYFKKSPISIILEVQ